MNRLSSNDKARHGMIKTQIRVTPKQRKITAKVITRIKELTKEYHNNEEEKKKNEKVFKMRP